MHVHCACSVHTRVLSLCEHVQLCAQAEFPVCVFVYFKELPPTTHPALRDQAFNCLVGHTQQTAGKLTVPIVAMHPDWQVMLDVLYGFIANQSFPAHELLTAQPPMPTEVASNMTFLKFNSAARTTAAALFCHLTQLRSKRDAVDEAKLDSSDIRFMYKTLQTMHFMLTVASHPHYAFAVYT